MPSIYDLAERQRDLKDEIERAIIEAEGELTPEIEEKIRSELELGGDIKQKLNGYYKILRELDEHANALGNEIERLKDRKKKAERAQEQLESNVQWYMQVKELDSIRCDLTEFKRNQVGGTRPITITAPNHVIPNTCKKYRFKITVDGKDASEQDLEDLRAFVDELTKGDGITAKVNVSVLKSRVADLDDTSLMRYEPRKEYLDY